MAANAEAPHLYALGVTWTGNRGGGTSAYAAYGREFVVSVPGKPDLAGSADPVFRGDPERHNPEDLFLAALSACHMLFFLSLCARAGIRVTAYEDWAQGSLTRTPGGGGRFAAVVLRPTVTVAHERFVAPAVALHEEAHRLCFIAASCAAPVRVEPVVRAGPGEPSAAHADGGRP